MQKYKSSLVTSDLQLRRTFFIKFGISMQKLAFWILLLYPVFIFMCYQSMYLKLECLLTSVDVGNDWVGCVYYIHQFVVYMSVCISYVFHDCYVPAFVVASSV